MKGYSFPAGYNFFRSLYRTYRQINDPIGSMVESMTAFNGTYSVHLGAQRFIVTQDPAFIEYVLKTNHRNYHKSEFQSKRVGQFLGKGLLTSNGEYWLRQRRLIQPGFHQEKIRSLYAIMKTTIDDFLLTMPVGEHVNVYPHMNKLAFQIVMNTLFNVHVEEALREELSAFVYESQDFVMRDIRQPHLSWWFRLSGELNQNLKKASRAREIIRSIITQRKASQGKHADLLDMLLDARYEDTGAGMDEEQIIDEILVLIIAGHETTANALSWTLFLLAEHPAEIERLRNNTSELAIEDVVRNEFVLSVINESMRLFPPAYVSDRVALKDDRFGSFSYPGGTIIVVFYYGLHRDPKHWQQPEVFNPARFLQRDRNANGKIFLPFGAGPRLCIGNGFAMAEMAIFLHTFMHYFDIRSTQVKPQINALITLKPDRVVLNISRTH
jgi:cytochrome P450